MTRNGAWEVATGHASRELLRRYATGDPGLPADAVWAVETHLEACRGCRAHVASVVHTEGGDVGGLLGRVGLALARQRELSPPGPARSRWAVWRAPRWAPAALLPWLVMTVAVVFTAVVLDLMSREYGRPPLLLLLAPVAPLAGVAAAWSQGRDPAFELTAATPRAGLELVFRRTLVVLVVIIPALLVGGLVVGVSPALWLLPCLAFVCGALALGQAFGLARASAGLGLMWTAVVVAPSLVTNESPVVLEPVTMPAWTAAAAAAVVALVVRRHTLTRLPSGR